MTLTISNVAQGTDAWHDQRRGIVTASVVNNLVSVRKLSAIDYACPNCSAPASEPCRGKKPPHTAIKTLHTERAEASRASSTTVLDVASNDDSRNLSMGLARERFYGWTEDNYVSFDMQRGIDDEPRARDLYSERYAPVKETGFMVEDKWGFKIGYSPDGLVGDDGLIEIKSRRPRTQFATILAGHPPAENMAQLQCGLLVSGRKWIDYISYAGGMHMWVHRVYPDPRWFEAIVKAVRAFEANAAEMLRLYSEAVEPLPMTERVLTEMEFAA